ncbi:Uncharacterised protein [Mycobacteroides abscessus subsp. abscessus]|nr:Uncharacterised protein [Mycobacteroides abscessus subsp. abscessus]
MRLTDIRRRFGGAGRRRLPLLVPALAIRRLAGVGLAIRRLAIVRLAIRRLSVHRLRGTLLPVWRVPARRLAVTRGRITRAGSTLGRRFLGRRFLGRRALGRRIARLKRIVRITHGGISPCRRRRGQPLWLVALAVGLVGIGPTLNERERPMAVGSDG